MGIFFRRLLRVKNELLDFFFPSECPICGKLIYGNPRPCSRCIKGLFAPRLPVCINCGRPLGFFKKKGEKCEACKIKPFFRGKVAIPLYYHGCGGFLVRALKFKKDMGAGFFLAKTMVRAGRAAGILRRDKKIIIVPVPLHWKKKRKRGFDQALFLAENISTETGIKFLPVLKRKRYTIPQGDPLNMSREQNVKDAFEVRWFYRKIIKGKEIILIDDVVTSGATARECRKILIKRGASKVHLLASCLGYIP